jgi:hypothetical protein
MLLFASAPASRRGAVMSLQRLVLLSSSSTEAYRTHWLVFQGSTSAMTYGMIGEGSPNADPPPSQPLEPPPPSEPEDVPFDPDEGSPNSDPPPPPPPPPPPGP